MTANLAKRSEFLFLYDTRMANPNGDPDENRPRIDPYSGRNLVTEYRLKRTVRDYLKDQKERIFIREDLNGDGSRKTIEELAKPYIKEEKKEKTVDKTVDKTRLIGEHIDVRLFGLLFAVPNATFKSVGPVQFSIGQSLNKVQEIVVRNTRVVPTKEGAEAGTFGEKTILRYSLIMFHGFLNQVVAKDVNLAEDDVNKMMMAMWHGTNNLSTSSKFGQASRFLLRVIYSDDRGYIGDLDRGIVLKNTENIEDISQAGIDASKLFSMLTDNKGKIAEIQFGCQDNIVLANGTDNLKTLTSNWAKDNGIQYQDILNN